MNLTKVPYLIAIDGPAGSGKSTTAKKVASKLNLMYLDTGAMYRAVALYFINNQIPLKDFSNKLLISSLLNKIEIKFCQNSGNVFLNGFDVSSEIRQDKVSSFVSDVSAIPQVREKMVSLQRKIATNANVVLEGRDIGTRVFPDAELKIFLIADVLERGKRRHKELLGLGEVKTLDAVIDEIKFRDLKDSSRQHSPLVKAEDAVVIDTSNMSIDIQVNEIVSLIKTKKQEYDSIYE